MATLNDSQNFNNVAGLVATDSVAADAGDTIIVLIRERDRLTLESVVSSEDGALSAAVSNNASGGASYIYYLSDVSAATHTITMTWSGGTHAIASGYTMTWAGLATSGALDQSNQADNASGTAHNAGSITTTGAGLIVAHNAYSGNPGTATAGSDGFTKLEAQLSNRSLGQYKISSGAETVDADHTTSNSVSSDGAIANFLDAVAGGGGSHKLTLLGVG